jgi:hypothetical protein
VALVGCRTRDVQLTVFCIRIRSHAELNHAIEVLILCVPALISATFSDTTVVIPLQKIFSKGMSSFAPQPLFNTYEAIAAMDDGRR